MIGEGHGFPDNKYNPHAWIINEPKIGEGCWIGAFTVIDGIGGLTIGERCNISCGVHIMTHSTAKRCVTEGKYPVMDTSETVIGDCVFIGEHATILMGARIGHHSIIAAGTVVTEHAVIPAYSLVAGVPGRVIRNVEKEIGLWTEEGKKNE